MTHTQWLIDFLHASINNPNHFILKWSLIQLQINFCCLQDHEYHNGRRRTSKRQSRDLPFVKLLNISVTLSPYLSLDSRQFQTSIQDRMQDYWLGLPTGPQAHLVHVYLFCMSLMHWQTHSATWTPFIHCLSHYVCPWIGSIINSMERKILCQVEHHKSRSHQLVLGESEQPAQSLGHGVCDARGWGGKPSWTEVYVAFFCPHRRWIHQAPGRPRWEYRREYYC